MTENSNGMVMPVSPMYGGNGGMGGFGYGGDWWLILILLFAFGGFGWGNGFGGGAGAVAAEGSMLYPWMNQAQTTTNGFQTQAINSAISGLQNSVTSGFGDVQLGIAGVNQNVCQTGNTIASAVSNGFASAEASANARQMADMQQNFASQTAITGAITNLASQQASCCCENRLTTSQLNNTVQNEGNATRFADATNTRDIIENQNRNSQAIIDKLCALELDGVKSQLAQAQRENVGLQNQLNMASFRESQTAQNALISQGFANEVDQLYNRLSSCPVPTTPVYGRTPIFQCPQTINTGCGCSGNAF